MAKNKSAALAANPANDLGRRIDKAMSAGRYQTALELTKQLYKHEPTPTHHDLLFRVYLGRAKELRDAGRTRDAASVLENAIALAANDADKSLQIADALMCCGEIRRALQLIEWLPEPKPINQLLTKGADAALQRGASGRALLPESLHADFDCIRSAFAHVAAGQDDLAKAALQGIGLQSPFLEWKLFVRGLSAYYQNDEARALENWSRLDAARLPARLAAPYRFRIDEAFRSAQLPATQQALRGQSDKLHDDSIVSGLRRIQHECMHHKGLARALREAEQLMPALRSQAPHLIPKLANCFYWQLVEQGQPPDLERYRALFGRPPDDPNFDRLSAFVTESLPEYAEAHAYWQEFEKFLADTPPPWPAAEVKLARAMVWLRMANNARQQEKLLQSTMDFAEAFIQPRALKPTAEACLRQAIQLAPNRLAPHAELFGLLAQSTKRKQATEFGRRLLDRFPNHAPTLQALSGLLLDEEDYAGAIDTLKHALANDPLNRNVRSELGLAQRLHAGALTQAGRHDDARAAFAAALDNVEPWQRLWVRCQWAACEFKAGDDARAAELIHQAAESEIVRPAVSALMLAQSVHLKLAKPIKTRFENEFKAVLATSPNPATASTLARVFADYVVHRFNYYGQKTHQKKILALIETTLGMPYTEDDVRRLGTALLVLGSNGMLRKFTRQWRRDLPTSPYPPYLEIESYLTGDTDRWPLWRLKPMAEDARELAAALPPGEQRDTLLNLLDARLQQFHDLHPFASIFDQMRDRFDAIDADSDEDEPW